MAPDGKTGKTSLLNLFCHHPHFETVVKERKWNCPLLTRLRLLDHCICIRSLLNVSWFIQLLSRRSGTSSSIPNLTFLRWQCPPQKKTKKKNIRKQVHARHILQWHNNDWKQLSRPPQFSTECPLALWRTPCSAQVYELMIWPDQVSCFVPGFRCVIFTSTACTFRFLGGIRLTLYVTSSPSTGTYSPSMLKEKSQRVLSQDSKCFYEKKRSHAQLANVDGGFLKVQPQLTTLSSGKEQEVILFRSWKPNQ